jgi:hypothetical protein
MAWAFIGQHVTWTQAFGGAITLVGVLGALGVASAAGVLDREQTAAVAAEGI